ncbi:galactolipase DONGLE, chloroplastic-like [Arachis stenosperma]|uniref:galactolipase DONGLE, chloroplastic-like n=1 Tax=Arachis stenosperma TaxID=217475 RepID=UPI0025AC29A3|nr:galactolipase DONGLE, chloroplastic-like [Arachis stenosperma]
MASATHPPSINHVTFSQTTLPKSHSFGQVSLPIPTTNNRLHSSSSLEPQGFINTLVSNNNTNKQITTTLYKLWREVQGCNDWENLLNPLHPLLRQEIIRYGQFVRASYKAFDLDPTSKRYLNCKYGKNTMLKQVGMADSSDHHYQVTKYIYATPPDINIIPPSARWIGYVAVSSDESLQTLGRRDIVITFRGTVTNLEWISNLMSALTPANLDPQDPRPDVQVESGFLSLYTSEESADKKFGLQSCREQLLSEVSRLMRKHKGESVSITLAGHSLGSALALLLAYDIAELGLNNTSRREEVPITVFSFGGPRVGNLQFKKRCEELGVKVLRIANVNDPITKLPGVVFNDDNLPWSCSCYAHVGVELLLDFFNVQNPSCVHDLDTYIRLVRNPIVNSNRVQQKEQPLINLFMEKATHFLSTSQNNINILPQIFSAAANHQPASWLTSLSRDILFSCADELLFLALFLSSCTI